MKVEVINNQLVITMPIDPNPQPSSTGKTLLIASTHGSIKSGIQVSGKELTISVNAYIKR